MTENRNRILHLLMAGILLVSMYFVAGKGAMYVNGVQIEDEGRTQKQTKRGAEKEEQKEEICVVIDAGHGGTSIRPKKTV